MDFELNIGAEKPIKFRKPETLQKWVNGEKEFWSWLASSGSRYGTALWNEFSPQFGALDQHIVNLISNPENPQMQGRVQSIINSFQVKLSNDSYIYSKSNLAEFITLERKTSDDIAASIAYIATRQPGQNLDSQVDTLMAVAELSEYKRGTSVTGSSAAVVSLENSRNELLLLLDEAANASENRITKLDSLIKDREQKLQSSTTAMAKVLAAHKTNTHNDRFALQTETKDKTDLFVGELKEELAQIKQFYETEVALLEPIEYWKKKSRNHKIATGIFALVFLVYCYVSVDLLRDYLMSFESGLTGFITFWKDATISAFAAFAGIIGNGMVFARLLYRLFSSQLHLWNDSSERVTMIQTYLSMAQKGHAKEEFLGALLYRLFSPASDGVVKDDLNSISVMDAFINKMGSGS
ncbi:MAG: hypothetical protein KAS85_04945 [Rhodobacteraceae bacterium]|nr:hypothetical protein [Paracoccaceae bacterium]